MSVTIPLKRGDTFLLEATSQQGGTPQDLTGWAIRSQVRNGSNLVAELEVSFTDREAGSYRLACPASATQEWPVKALDCDIEYTSPAGQVVSTDTFKIDVKADVTR